MAASPRGGMGFGGSANRVRTCGRATTRALVILCALASLGACSGLDLDKFNIFAAKEEPTVDVPADQLYNQAVFLLNEKNDYKEAAKKFEEVDRQHPYSDWARKSLIMSAFAYYEARQYDDCIASAKRYISLHPGSAEAPYAQYLIGASYFDQIPDVSRDQSRTEKAIQALDELNRKYPSSEYASDARKKIEMARDQRQKDFIGAINRFKVVVTQYQTTRHVEEALLRLTECYMTLGIVQEAQTAAAVLGHNFPDSKWYKEAYELVKSGGLEPKESDGWMSQAFKKVGLGTLSQR
jgi:outer membrane protein assembly factor BamD